MKYSVKKEDILPLLSRVNNVVEKKSTQKVRTNILIKAQQDNLELVGFDNEIKISGQIPAKVDETGEITVTSQKLFDIVKTLANDTNIEFQLLDNSLHINAGASKFKLATISADDYPLPDQYSFEQNLTLPCHAFVDMLNRVKFSMGVNDVRHYLNGLLLHFKGNKVVAVSTDGHRLSVAETTNPSEIHDIKLIIPRKTIGEISSWLNAEEGEVSINFSDTHIQFVLNAVEITSTLINAEYPAYETVIPELSENTIVLPKEALKQSLQRAKILSSEYGVGVSLAFNPWLLTLTAKNVDNESVEDKLDINYDGEQINIAFNINYLIDTLNVIDNENISMSIQDSQSSCLIFDKERDDAKYIVMPMNI